MEQHVVNLDTSNNRSVLAGYEYEKAGEFYIHREWEQMLVQQPGLLQRPALIVPNQKNPVTFAELDRRSARLADKIWSLQPSHRQPNELIIAVCMTPCDELIVTLLAIFKLGAAYLPIDPSFPTNRIIHILEDAKPSLIVTTKSIKNDIGLDRLAGPDANIFCNEEKTEEDSNYDHPIEFPLQSLAVVLYTSGSTGTPKGVRLTHRNVVHRLAWQWRTFPYQSDEICCFKTALTFVDSIAEIWAPLLKGIPIVIVTKQQTQDTNRFISLLDYYKVTRLVLVPSLLSSIIAQSSELKSSERRCNSIRLWVCSGEVLTAHLLREFFRHLAGKICNFYGSTEVTGDVTYAVFGNEKDVGMGLHDEKVPLGIALDNCTVYLLNSFYELVDCGQIGEIFIAGAHVADGYINGDKMETSSFIRNTVENKEGYETIYRTGDYGRIINGKLYYEGRADSQVKVRGHRVDLTEINAAVQSLDQVSKCVVLCYKPGQPEQEIVAFVVSQNGCSASLHQILKQKLVSYAMPRVVLVEEIPLLVNGKVDRQQLLRDYAKIYKSKLCPGKWNENELNRMSARERHKASALFKTVLSVLGGLIHKPLALMDNFFYVGGNSLNAVIVVTKLRDQGFFLELGDFLEADNFQQVVAKMEDASKCRLMDPLCSYQTPQHVLDYKIEMLNESIKDEVKRIVCECFSQKGDLELLTGVTYEDYEELFPDIWKPILKANLSFVVKNHKNQIVACGMNCDAFSVPETKPKAKRLSYVFEVLEYVKGPAREQLVGNKKGYVLQNFLVVTDGSQLSPAENVALVEAVEEETLSLAKKNGFQYIFTSNSSPLTQQICNDVLYYQILKEYQVNQFIASDGTKPFIMAPDSQLITIGIKKL